MRGNKSPDGFTMKIRGSARDILIDSDDSNMNELEYKYDDDHSDTQELEEMSSDDKYSSVISS